MAKFKVDITRVNTSNLEVLTNEEMKELFNKYKNGDKEARDRIASGNLKLVLSILRKFSRSDENKDDLFQIGCIGLMKAIDNFDPNYGVKFSTYCVPMILGEIRRYVRDNSSLRVSRSLKDISYKSIKAKEELSIVLGRTPTNSELSNYLGIEELQLVEALQSRKIPVSIFEPIYNDGGDTIYLYDQIEDKKTNKINLDDYFSLKDAIKKLDEREYYIINQRFVIGKTQVELSKELNISQAQISRIEKKALDSLKKNMNDIL